MNWLVEGTDNYASEYFSGMEMAYPERWKKLSGDNNSAVLVKRECTHNQVAVIVSGGAANGPLFPGYVADGLADAAVVGGPYGAPNAYAIYETGKYLGKEKGALLLYNNFAGDYLNNDMAQELLEMDGIMVESVVVTDDIASALGEDKSHRSGRCGIALLIKIAGSCAKKGMTLKDTASILRRANARAGTLSVMCDFEKQEVMFGNGFSGEPGFLTISDMSMSNIAAQAMEILTEDIKPKSDEKLYFLVNRMRNASYADSFKITKYAMNALSKEYDIMRARVANYSNIIDVYGFDFCILCANEELQAHLNDTIYTDSFVL